MVVVWSPAGLGFKVGPIPDGDTVVPEGCPDVVAVSDEHDIKTDDRIPKQLSFIIII